MKALLSFSLDSGKGIKKKKLDFVISRLKEVFELEIFCSKSKEEAFKKYQETDADSIIVLGGDGHFNNLLNALMPLEKKPKIGYLNFGTLGDVGRMFGLTGHLKHDLKIITDGLSKDFDVGEITKGNDSYYFMYVACVGAYSDIPYASKKKRFGKLTYYLKAIPKVFKKVEVEYSKNKNEKTKAPFLLIMNGTHMAGFKINKDSKPDDGLFELYETRKGFFNGLLHYLPFKTQKHEAIKAISLNLDDDFEWCLDGEKGPKGSIYMKIKNHAISAYFSKKV